jgi:cation:H+ antiporter
VSPRDRRQLVGAGAAALGGLFARLAGHVLPAPVATVGLGAGLVGGALLLAWAADAAEVDVSGRLVLTVVALVAVLPEFTVETHFAFTQQTTFISANLTGATRLLVTGAAGMPLLGAWLLSRRGEKQSEFRLPPERRLDLGVLLLASCCAVGIAATGRLSLITGLVLICLYVVYVRRVQGTPDEPPAVVGVAAALAALPDDRRKPVTGALLLFSAIVVFAVASAFADALLATGTSLGIDPYLLVQSVVPAATEIPEFVVVAVLALSHRPAQGLAIFLAAAVSQMTLALGTLPFAYLAGGGGSSIPLAGREQLEMMLTAATTLMAVAALASLTPKRIDAWIVLTLFGVQFAFPSTMVRIGVTIVLAMFALDVLASRRRCIGPMLAAVRAPTRRAALDGHGTSGRG